MQFFMYLFIYLFHLSTCFNIIDTIRSPDDEHLMLKT